MNSLIKNKNSKNNDIKKNINDSHNLASLYTKWRDTSMRIRSKKYYLNNGSFLEGYL